MTSKATKSQIYTHIEDISCLGVKAWLHFWCFTIDLPTKITQDSMLLLSTTTHPVLYLRKTSVSADLLALVVSILQYLFCTSPPYPLAIIKAYLIFWSLNVPFHIALYLPFSFQMFLVWAIDLLSKSLAV